MSLATLNGHRVTRCRVQIPAWGVPWFDVESDHGEVLSGAATLVLDDLTLKGTIVSGGAHQARTRYRIAGGAAGWGKSIGAQSYANDIGVKRSTVLGDAARACGETIADVPTGTIGPAFVRHEGPASRVLEKLSPRAWYVDETGVTRIGRRAAVTYAGNATRMENAREQGRIELAPTSLATLIPGAVVDGLEAVDVEHVLDGKVRTTIWGRGISDTTRLPDALRRIVEAFTESHRYFAPWEYRVVERSTERLNLQIVRVSTGMPDLLRVRIRPGVSGLRAHPKLGSLVLVSFVNGDPSMPVATAFDDADSPGFVPDELFVQAGSTGDTPTEHATSAESLLLAFQCILHTLGLQLNALGPVPLLANALGALLVSPANATFIATGVAAMASGPLATINPSIVTALTAALAAKTDDSSGGTPNIGWPKVRGG